MSAVIPALDSAAELPLTLAALAGAALIGEIVVVHGGSQDCSAELARAAGAKVIAAPRGRGAQLAAGAREASGEWLLFIHADCRPLPGWEAVVETFVADSDPHDRVGDFTLALD
jgi:glycosyltransferase involved in cell wall biosynthesis